MMGRFTIAALVAVAALCLPGLAFAQATVSLDVASTTGTIAGNEIVFESGGGTVTFDIDLNVAVEFTGVDLRAQAIGTTLTGTKLAVGTLISAGDPAGPAMDNLQGWAYLGLFPPFPAAGDYPLGTVTLAVTSSDSTLVFGDLAPPDTGVLDSSSMPVAVTDATFDVRIVPEPGAAALMLAMIGTVGFISRRARAA